ncbi:hypothetical protein AMAG_08171 [Allomyces macrogynus ATCC 38327]|uniref:Uncharacterized protein n=1 Tax=Allomyces macrogynus (strain ATCC 38327) TaxID=578462 RepID=A0A0L0SKU4_ALLM3|nr:hypothetical protein AMAG_08171 [Allomyces macrogynus ATCC 38327]|eukprot:KNE62999.1 hypothetical protein AMAG_08171 [Allomyces macrogynus ATCC 38327]
MRPTSKRPRPASTVMSRSHATMRVLSTAKLTVIALAALFWLITNIAMVVADPAAAPPAPSQPAPPSGIPPTWNPQRATRDSIFAPFPATFTLLARASDEVGSITLATNGSATVITAPPATAIHIASTAAQVVLDAVAAKPLTTAAVTWTYWTPSQESTLGRLELMAAAATRKKGANAARQVWVVKSATEDLPASRLRVEQVSLPKGEEGVGLVPVGTVEMRRKKQS